jgi:hypothetical protein
LKPNDLCRRLLAYQHATSPKNKMSIVGIVIGANWPPTSAYLSDSRTICLQKAQRRSTAGTRLKLQAGSNQEGASIIACRRAADPWGRPMLAKLPSK